MSQAVTVRLPEPSWLELRQIATREHRSVDEMVARLVTEGLREDRFPYIEFRSFNGERHACIKGRLQVWQLVLAARDLGMDVNATAFHLDLMPEAVSDGLHYYEAYPDEIDLALAENDLGYDRLKETLPNLQLVSLPLPGETKAGA
jgi:hypothetical protein